jgi:hypothetical protein
LFFLFGIARRSKADYRKEGENMGKKIDGLGEILETVASWRRYNSMYKRELDTNKDEPYSDKLMAVRPRVMVDELLAKYPRAAAYTIASDWTRSPNCIQRVAGKRAQAAIVANEDYVAAIETMIREWNAHSAKYPNADEFVKVFVCIAEGFLKNSRRKAAMLTPNAL